MANKPITEKEKQAWIFARNAHKGQVRKFINKPYFTFHVVKVNSIVKKNTLDEDLLCASLLHDTIEDCFDDIDVGYEIIKEKFGKKIADIVLELTSLKDDIDNIYGGSKSEYLINKMIHLSDGALIVKLADRLQNIEDSFTATEKFRNKYFKETTKIINELKKYRRFNRIQYILYRQIKAKLGNIEAVIRKSKE